MYIVEGNIGVGKSTFLRLIHEQLPLISPVYEPVQNWQNIVAGQSILENFYRQPERWAFSMETIAMACRVQEHLKEQHHPNNLRLMERSIFSGHYVFATNGRENGFLSDLEWNIYLEWFNFLVSKHCKAPEGFIYLRVDPEVAYERILKRNRFAESSISLDYIKQIHRCHEDFLIHKKSILAELHHVPILVLDCNTEFESNQEELERHARALSVFMNIDEAKNIVPSSLIIQP